MTDKRTSEEKRAATREQGRLQRLFQRTLDGRPNIKKKVRCIEGYRPPECRCIYRNASGWCTRDTYNGRQPRINPNTGRCELYNKLKRHPKMLVKEVDQ